jgi:hypothetical protein
MKNLITFISVISLVACGDANEESVDTRTTYVSPEIGSQDATGVTAPATPGATPTIAPTPVPTINPVPSKDVILIGVIDPVSADGDVTGWAADQNNAEQTFKLSLKIDGVSLEASFAADLANASASVAGNHGFKTRIPDNFRDGKSHTLNISVWLTPNMLDLEETNVEFTLAAPRPQGAQFFATSVQPLLQNQCSSCHPVNYAQQMASLRTPAAAMGGTAANNELINMAAGRNGNRSHPGGNICGTKNAAPCNTLQQWWNIEFAP